MIHDSWVWLACVSRATSGNATLSDAIADTTVARARHVTARTAPGRKARTGPAAGPVTGDAGMGKSPLYENWWSGSASDPPPGQGSAGDDVVEAAARAEARSALGVADAEGQQAGRGGAAEQGGPAGGEDVG